MSKNEKKKLDEMGPAYNLKTHKLGHKEQHPVQSELEKHLKEMEDSEKEKDEKKEMHEDKSEAEHKAALPTHSLGFKKEVPEGELSSMAGKKEEFLGLSDVHDSSKEKAHMMESEELEEMEKKVDEWMSSKKKKAMKESSHEEESEKEDDEDEDEDAKKMKESFVSMFEGEELSESFKTKVSTIFESSLNLAVQKYRTSIREAYSAVFSEKIAKIEESLTNVVSDYLEYVVNEWAENNEVAIVSSLKSDITEQFIEGLKGLFEASYVDVPEEKVNLIESLENKVTELEKELNEQTQRNVKLNKQMKLAIKEKVIAEQAKELTMDEYERLCAMTEKTSFSDESELKEKVEILKESFFKKSSSKSDSNEKLFESGIVPLTEDSSKAPSGEDEDYVDAYIKAMKNQVL